MALLDFVNLQLAEFSFIALLALVIYSVVTLSGQLYGVSVLGLWLCFKVIKRRTAGRVDAKDRAVFITGCDTGFGHDLARRLDERGFTVFAGCLHPDGTGARKLKSDSSKRLHIVPIDVGSDSSMQEAHDYVKKHLPKNGLWAIVSNAGFNVFGDVELLTIDLYKKAMNVNFYGAVRTIRNFLYLVRKIKGRVAIVSSVKGLTSWPADSAHHLTKRGLETLSDCLRLEMRKFGVSVSVIEPGNFSIATACQDERHFKRYEAEAEQMWNAATDDVRSTYGRVYLDNMLEKQRSAFGNSGGSTKPVIDALEDAIMSERPETRYLIDGGTWFDMHTTIARYYEYIPTWLSDLIITKITGCDRFPAETKSKSD